MSFLCVVPHLLTCRRIFDALINLPHFGQIGIDVIHELVTKKCERSLISKTFDIDLEEIRIPIGCKWAPLISPRVWVARGGCFFGGAFDSKDHATSTNERTYECNWIHMGCFICSKSLMRIVLNTLAIRRQETNRYSEINSCCYLQVTFGRTFNPAHQMLRFDWKSHEIFSHFLWRDVNSELLGCETAKQQTGTGYWLASRRKPKTRFLTHRNRYLDHFFVYSGLPQLLSPCKPALTCDGLSLLKRSCL